MHIYPLRHPLQARLPSSPALFTLEAEELLFTRADTVASTQLSSLGPGCLAHTGDGLLGVGKRREGASSSQWSLHTVLVPPQLSLSQHSPPSFSYPSAQASHRHPVRRVLVTFSSCMVNSLPCSLALFIMKSRASLWSSELVLCSFSCIAFSMNSCSMSRALIPCGRQTQVRGALGMPPSPERPGDPFCGRL